MKAQTGIDDILAMLLALSSNPEELEVLLLSVTYGNVEVERYLMLEWESKLVLILI